MRRLLIVLAVALVVLLAGCAGVPAGDDLVEETPTEQDGDDVPSDDTSDEADSDSDTGEETAPTVDGELELHHIDVGQADATLIITPADETILIDTGDWRQGGEGVIEYLEDHDIDRIDHLVATHGHADHIGVMMRSSSGQRLKAMASAQRTTRELLTQVKPTSGISMLSRSTTSTYSSLRKATSSRLPAMSQD